MKTFLQAHATHPDWRFALALLQPQLEAQRRERAPCEPTLGWVYLSDHYAGEAEALLAELQRHWPRPALGRPAGGGGWRAAPGDLGQPARLGRSPAMPRGDFRVFSGARPLGAFPAHTAQVHADPNTPDLAELVADMSDRTTTGYLFGGLASARSRTLHIADGVLHGGLSGVAFASGVGLVSRVTQGCQPVGRTRTITESSQNVITKLDGEPALDVLLADLNLAGREPREALPQIRQTLVGLSDPNDPSRRSDDSAATRRGAFGPDARVRHLIGLDPARRGIAIGDVAPEGLQLAFCQRNTEAARRDLVRICAEIREELAPEELPVAATLPAGATPEAGASGIAGAVYVSCSGRGGPHFGGPSAELQIVRRALGEVPLVGFFAAGEIARHHLYGYTGVLTVFTTKP